MSFRQQIPFLAFAVVVSLSTSAPRAAATIDEVAEIASKAIQRIDRAELADCEPDDRDRFPGATFVCGSFRGSFSALKFQLESNLSLQEFEPMVKARDAWTLRSGTYSRDLDVLGRAVTFRFKEPTGAISLVIGEELPPPKRRKSKKEDSDEEEKKDEDGEEEDEDEPDEDENRDDPDEDD